jgi:hypothetical protein
MSTTVCHLPYKQGLGCVKVVYRGIWEDLHHWRGIWLQLSVPWGRQPQQGMLQDPSPGKGVSMVPPGLRTLEPGQEVLCCFPGCSGLSLPSPVSPCQEPSGTRKQFPRDNPWVPRDVAKHKDKKPQWGCPRSWTQRSWPPGPCHQLCKFLDLRTNPQKGFAPTPFWVTSSLWDTEDLCPCILIFSVQLGGPMLIGASWVVTWKSSS